MARMNPSSMESTGKFREFVLMARSSRVYDFRVASVQDGVGERWGGYDLHADGGCKRALGIPYGAVAAGKEGEGTF